MPPPPAQITTQPFSSSDLIGLISKIRFGTGDGTTRRNLPPSGLNVHPFSASRRAASSASYSGPIGFVGFAKAGSSASTSIIVSSVARWRSKGSCCRALAGYVADHPLGLGAEHVERVRVDGGVGAAQEREQADLGPFPCEMTRSCSSATGASALHAARALARWFSAVSGSPRRSSALPPSATTTRTFSPRAWRRAPP